MMMKMRAKILNVGEMVAKNIKNTAVASTVNMRTTRAAMMGRNGVRLGIW